MKYFLGSGNKQTNKKTYHCTTIDLAKLPLRDCDIDMFTTTNKSLLKKLLKDILHQEGQRVQKEGLRYKEKKWYNF